MQINSDLGGTSLLRGKLFSDTVTNVMVSERGMTLAWCVSSRSVLIESGKSTTASLGQELVRLLLAFSPYTETLVICMSHNHWIEKQKHLTW